MTDERFDALMDELIGGLPPEWAVKRLQRTIRAMVMAAPETSGAEDGSALLAHNVFERIVDEYSLGGESEPGEG